MTNDNTLQRPGMTSLLAGTYNADDIADYYDDWAKTYDKTLDGWEYLAPSDAAALITPHLERGSRILDIGCGTGLMSQALGAGDGNFHLTGLDISAASLNQAEERGTYENLICHNLQKLPLPVDDDAFDAAVSVGVLTYIPEPGALFREVCRCVRSEGLFGFTHRTDRWKANDFDGLLNELCRESLWSVEHISEPHGYLPGSEDFGDEITIIHALCRVK